MMVLIYNFKTHIDVAGKYSFKLYTEFTNMF